MQVVYLVVAGLATGLTAGVFGIGGGILLVPILVLLFQYPQHTANGISLVALLLPVGALGVLEYYRADKITLLHIKYGLLIGLGIFVGTYLGSKFAISIPAKTLEKVFALFLFAIAIRLWFSK